jgi:hypothetical protein
MTTAYTTSIRDAVIEQVRFKANLNYDIRLTQSAKKAIGDFLDSQENLSSGVNVVFVAVLPEGYTPTYINNGDHELTVAFGTNNGKGKYPNVLFCSLTKTQRAKFRGFWLNRGLPLELMEEAIENLDLTKPVEILTFFSPRDWNLMRKSDSDKESIKFIGQALHTKNGSFIPHLPIGYVTQSNKLVITTPRSNLPRRNQYMFA